MSQNSQMESTAPSGPLPVTPIIADYQSDTSSSNFEANDVPVDEIDDFSPQERIKRPRLDD